MKFRKPTFPLFFRKLSKKSGGGGSPVDVAGGGYEVNDGDVPVGNSERWSFNSKSFSSATGLRWKKKFTVYTWFIDGFLFKIVYVLEAVVLVFTLCFFYLCCGCHL